MNSTDPFLADALRHNAVNDARVIVPAEVRAVLADAVDIADDCARADVECNSTWLQIDGRRWFVLDWEGAAKDESEDMLRKSVTYLEQRGLIDLDYGPDRVAFKP